VYVFVKYYVLSCCLTVPVGIINDHDVDASLMIFPCGHNAVMMDVENRAEWRRRTRVADPSPEGFNPA